MAISIRHKFVSAKSDGSDPTKVQPSNWNDTHALQMATLRIIGRLTAGTGDAEELPITAFMAGLLQSTSGDDFFARIGAGGFVTGDIKYGVNSTAAAGWITIAAPGQTIGNAASGASRANADTQALFTVLWNNFAQADATVQTSAGVTAARGASAANDFAANRRITLPAVCSRFIISAGTGTGLAGYGNGTSGGAQDVTLTENQIPSHTHNNAVGEPGGGHQHSYTSNVGAQFQLAQGAGGLNISLPFSAATAAAFANVFILNAAAGGGASHTNVPPYLAMYAQIKL